MSGKKFYADMSADVLARTIWGEARSEGQAGMEAVACVVANRVAIAQARNGFWWGNDIILVCPNREKLLAVSEKNIHFATCLRIARRCVAGCLDDITNGATHYHTKAILPHWAEGQTPVAVIGSHVFYKLEG
jgi:spore germination cell wall hydrolase CwlJ-like protein